MHSWGDAFIEATQQIFQNVASECLVRMALQSALPSLVAQWSIDWKEAWVRLHSWARPGAPQPEEVVSRYAVTLQP